MRSILLPVFALPLLALVPPVASLGTPGPAALHGQDSEEFDPDDWTEVLTRELPDGLVRISEGQGAMGSSVYGVELGKVRGTLILDRRYGDQVSIFLGWSPPSKYADEAHEDLRVRFRDTSGEAHVTRRFAGGWYGAQFASPGGVEIEELEDFTLLVRSKAKWLKGK